MYYISHTSGNILTTGLIYEVRTESMVLVAKRTVRTFCGNSTYCISFSDPTSHGQVSRAYSWVEDGKGNCPCVYFSDAVSRNTPLPASIAKDIDCVFNAIFRSAREVR